MRIPELGNVIVCTGPHMAEFHRESFGVKWCFHCRSRNNFDWVAVGADMPKVSIDDPAMYLAEPYSFAECSGCGSRDSQLFPGWSYADE